MRPLFHEYFNFVAGILLLLDQGVGILYALESWEGLVENNSAPAYLSLYLIPILLYSMVTHYYMSTRVKKFKSKIIPRGMSRFWRKSWKFASSPMCKLTNFKTKLPSILGLAHRLLALIASIILTGIFTCCCFIANLPYILLSNLLTLLWTPYFLIGGLYIWFRLPYLLPLHQVNLLWKKHIQKSLENELSVLKILTWITMLQVVFSQVPVLYVKITYNLFVTDWTPISLGSVLITVFNTIYHSARLAYYLFKSSQENDMMEIQS